MCMLLGDDERRIDVSLKGQATLALSGCQVSRLCHPDTHKLLPPEYMHSYLNPRWVHLQESDLVCMPLWCRCALGWAWCRWPTCGISLKRP